MGFFSPGVMKLRTQTVPRTFSLQELKEESNQNRSVVCFGSDKQYMIDSAGL